VEGLQIGRGWLYWIRIAPQCKRLDRAQWQRKRVNGDRQINVDIDGFLMVESNLLAFAPCVLLCRRVLLAMAVMRTAAFRARPHEVLFAGNATAPHKSREKQQRKK
jgi:hypothetical protein